MYRRVFVFTFKYLYLVVMEISRDVSTIASPDGNNIIISNSFSKKESEKSTKSGELSSTLALDVNSPSINSAPNMISPDTVQIINSSDTLVMKKPSVSSIDPNLKNAIKLLSVGSNSMSNIPPQMIHSSALPSISNGVDSDSTKVSSLKIDTNGNNHFLDGLNKQIISDETKLSPTPNNGTEVGIRILEPVHTGMKGLQVSHTMKILTNDSITKSYLYPKK